LKSVEDRLFKEIKKEKCILLVFIKQKKNLFLAPTVALDGFFGHNYFGMTMMSPTGSLLQVLYVIVHLRDCSHINTCYNFTFLTHHPAQRSHHWISNYAMTTSFKELR
jgi:hypothetical protein